MSNFNDCTRDFGGKWKSKHKAKYIHGALKRNPLTKKINVYQILSEKHICSTTHRTFLPGDTMNVNCIKILNMLQFFQEEVLGKSKRDKEWRNIGPCFHFYWLSWKISNITTVYSTTARLTATQVGPISEPACCDFRSSLLNVLSFHSGRSKNTEHLLGDALKMLLSPGDLG